MHQIRDRINRVLSLMESGGLLEVVYDENSRVHETVALLGGAIPTDCYGRIHDLKGLGRVFWASRLSRLATGLGGVLPVSMRESVNAVLRNSTQQ